MRSRTKSGLLISGAMLIAAGLGLTLLASRSLPPSVGVIAAWLMRLWPVFLVMAGVVRVMGFAIDRKPRSPFGGTVLIIIGMLLLAGRFHSNLNALNIYGRYWPVLLAIFAGVELLRYYSHRHLEGPPPRLFTPFRLVVIGLIVGTGVLANRVAANNRCLLSAIKLPEYISGLRDSITGQPYSFSDPPFVAPLTQPGLKITVNNSYGDVKVVGGGSALRAILIKGVRAWDEADARRIADRIRLVVDQTPDGYTITTNRDQVDEQFTTDIQIEVPTAVALALTSSFGTVSASRTQGPLLVNAANSQVTATSIAGDVTVRGNYCEVGAAKIEGDLNVTGAKRIKVEHVDGSVNLSASNGSVDLREVSGAARVDAPFSRVTADGLTHSSWLKTEHGEISVTRAGEVAIEARHSDVRAENISGDLRIASSHGSIRLRGLLEGLKVLAQQSSVSLENTRGPVDVETSHGEVLVRNFYDSVRVRTSYRDVRLITDSEPLADIDVEDNHGEIKLVLPHSSEFQLEAMSRSGQIKPVGFDVFPTAARENLTLTLGSGGPKIKLKTTYRNITIQAAGPGQVQTSVLQQP